MAPEAPTGDYHYLEIQKISGSAASFNVARVPEAEILALCSEDKHRFSSNEPDLSTQWSLRILFSNHTGSHDPYPDIPATVMNPLENHWKITGTCFRAFRQPWSCVMSFAPVLCDPSWKGYLVCSEKHYGNWWGPSGMTAISHNRATQTTYGFCVGISEDYINQVIEQLEESKELAGNPLLVPVLLIDLCVSRADRIDRRNDTDFQRVHRTMVRKRGAGDPKNNEGADHVEFARKLTGWAAGSAGLTACCKTYERILHYLLGSFEEQKCDNGIDEKVREILNERTVLVKELLIATMQNNAYNKEAIDVQLQMIFSYSAQRDNELNFRLAKESQRHNEYNLRLSHFAANEAHLNLITAKTALRHGLDMRIIAAVTLIFLPGTFVATFLSPSFWKFDPGEGKVVSKWIWLYWGLTGALTVAVLGAWKFVGRHKEKELEKMVEKDTAGVPEIDEDKIES